MLYGYALEPGDLFRLSGVANGFDQGEVFKVISSSHGANYINEISGEAILKCSLTFDDTDPYWSDVILLLHANSDDPVVDSSLYDQAMLLSGEASLDTTSYKYGAGSFRFETTSGGGIASIDGAWGSQWDISPTNISPYTIELWARFAAVGTTSNQVLICRNLTFAGMRLWTLYNPMGTTDLLFNSYHSFQTVSLTTSGASLANGFWYHIAVDKDFDRQDSYLCQWCNESERQPG